MVINYGQWKTQTLKGPFLGCIILCQKGVSGRHPKPGDGKAQNMAHGCKLGIGFLRYHTSVLVTSCRLSVYSFD